MLGFLLPSLILRQEGRDVSDILGFYGAWGVTTWLCMYVGLCALWMSTFVPLWMSAFVPLFLVGFRNLPVQGRCCRNF